MGTPIVCDSPPSPICINANTARSWNPQGACVPENGSCNYPQNDQYCEFGCINGFCDGDPCEGITCNTPPSPQCYNPDGMCINGVCIYSSYSGACDDSNNCTNGDVCVNAFCQGTPVACNAPPAPECASNNSLRIYNTTGACAEEGCEYGSVVSSCNDGSACTANDYCDSGTCHPGPLINCDDSNPCTTNWCDPVLGCQTDLLSGGSCVTSSSDCPLGTCVSGTCMPVPDTTCTAEVGIDLCVEVEAPGRCTAAGECVPTEAPPGFTCPGCNGICIQCWIFQYCFEF
ncbi:MAG TPA: hypothetical protein EYN66_10605 [Myxococcales bacterium]|nr:hypothetical protein [Myxococcales bacterium]